MPPKSSTEVAVLGSVLPEGDDSSSSAGGAQAARASAEVRATRVTMVERTFTEPPAVGGARVRRGHPCRCMHLGPYSQLAAGGSHRERMFGPIFDTRTTPARGPDRHPVPPPAGVTSEPVATDPDFRYSDLLPTGADDTPYRLVTSEGVSTFEANGRTFLQVSPEAIRRLTAEAMHDIAHYLRPAHLAQLRRIIDDPESSGNDRFVALDLLKNVNISAGGVLPMCQDTAPRS